MKGADWLPWWRPHEEGAPLLLHEAWKRQGYTAAIPPRLLPTTLVASTWGYLLSAASVQVVLCGTAPGLAPAPCAEVIHALAESGLQQQTIVMLAVEAYKAELEAWAEKEKGQTHGL